MLSLLKDFIISAFPGFYRKKHFSDIDRIHFGNYDQFHQEAELLLLPLLLKQGNIFVDIGSNRGDYVYQASKRIDTAGIFAFEPNPILYKKLRQAFKKVNVFQVALSSSKGKSRLVIPFTDGHADDSLASIQQSEKSGHAAEYEVATDTLDNYTDQLNALSVVKIDVEGHEMQVLSGAKRTIGKFMPVLIIEMEQRHHSSDIRKWIIDFCKDQHYQCCIFDPDIRNVLLFDASQPLRQQMSQLGTEQYINNFVFLPQTGPNALSVTQLFKKIDEAKK